MDISLFLDDITLPVIDGVALLAVVGVTFLVILGFALLLALWLEEAKACVDGGLLQLAVLCRGGKWMRDAHSQLGQEAAYDNHLREK